MGGAGCVFVWVTFHILTFNISICLRVTTQMLPKLTSRCLFCLGLGNIECLHAECVCSSVHERADQAEACVWLSECVCLRKVQWHLKWSSSTYLSCGVRSWALRDIKPLPETKVHTPLRFLPETKVHTPPRSFGNNLSGVRTFVSGRGVNIIS